MQNAPQPLPSAPGGLGAGVDAGPGGGRTARGRGAGRSSRAARAAWRRAGVARYLADRVLQGICVVLGAVLVSFLLTNLVGSAALVRGGNFLSPERIEQLTHQLGYDRPVLGRFASYVGNVAHGDFGSSLRLGGSALGVVLDALPYTLMLVGGTLALALSIAVPVSVYSAIRPGALGERAVRRSLLVWQGVPEFWLAIMLVLLFSVTWRVFPAFGYDGPRSMVLPIVALTLPLVPAIVRLLRGELLDAMRADYVLALRAKGLSERSVVMRHALRNALPVFVTYLALQVGWLVAGTIIVETVFQWPGLGNAILTAVTSRDIPVVQAAVVVIATVFVVLNLAADLFVLAFDPRVRTGRL